MTNFQWSTIVSSTLLGAFLGALFYSRIADSVGRRKTLTIVSYVFFLSTLLSVLSNSYLTLLIARLVIGICIGISSFTAPLYISEVSPKKIRGSLLLFNNVAITSGEAVSFLMGYLLHNFSPNSWRIMFLIGIFPPIFLIIGLQYMPSSPRWIAFTKGIHHAKRLLLKIRKNTNIQEELKELSLAILNHQKSSFRNIFKKPVLKVLLLGILLGLFQKLEGINVIMFYGPYIFNKVGFNKSLAILSTFIMGSINTIFTFLTLFLIDRIGRKPLLIYGSFCCGVMLLIFSLSVIFDASPWVGFFSIFFYIIGFSVSSGCIFWVIISEIYPTKIRAAAMGLTVCIKCLADFFITLMFLSLYDSIGGGFTMIIFSLFSFLNVIFSFLYVPETKGVSLEKIEYNLYNNKKLRFLGS